MSHPNSGRKPIWGKPGSPRRSEQFIWLQKLLLKKKKKKEATPYLSHPEKRKEGGREAGGGTVLKEKEAQFSAAFWKDTYFIKSS